VDRFSIKVLHVASGFDWDLVFGIPDALKVEFSFVELWAPFKEPWLEWHVKTLACVSDFLALLKGLLEKGSYEQLVGTGFPVYISWLNKQEIILKFGYEKDIISEKNVIAVVLGIDEFTQAIKDMISQVIKILEEREKEKGIVLKGKKAFIDNYNATIEGYKKYSKIE